MNDTAARVLAAIPAIVFASVIVAYGGGVFAIGVGLLGVLCLHEWFAMTERVRPVKLAGFLGALGLVAAAHYGDQYQLVLVLVISLPVTFVLSLLRPKRANVSWAIGATMLGIVWIGLPLAHAVMLRDLDHGGALLVAVLLGTFLSDTCAYFAGRSWGRRPLAPLISPNKTVEGLLGGIAGGTFSFWLFIYAWHDFMPGAEALLIGFCVALVAPIGDLFESLLKRDLDVKDTGRVFGPHGGALDRLDAVLFTVVVAYYVSVAVL
jgi:phosphatidate cytidylyltransferase